MALTATQQQFMKLVKASLCGGSFDEENVDWAGIFSLAQQQKLLPCIFDAARKSPEAKNGQSLMAEAKRQVFRQVTTQTIRGAEFTTLYHRLLESGMHPIVVKGQLCSRLYPQQDHRISGDDDLLISPEEFPACHRLLLDCGLKTDVPDALLPEADEITYTREDGSIRLELHRFLFDSSKNAYDQLNPFFENVQPVKIGDFWSMPPHEHLLYLILHAYKHFVSCGVGLRQFCDIGLWAKNYWPDIDWGQLYEQCNRVHAAVFATAAFEITRTHLGIAFELPEPWTNSRDVTPLLWDSLCGGIYGTNDLTRLHAATVTLNTVKAARIGGKSSVAASVFPKREYLLRRYPYLQQHPWLLPVAWGQRIFHYIREKRGRGRGNSAVSSVKLAKERVELLRFYDVIE